MKDLLIFLLFSGGTLLAEGAVDKAVAHVGFVAGLALLILAFAILFHMGRKPPEDTNYHRTKEQNSRR